MSPAPGAIPVQVNTQTHLVAILACVESCGKTDTVRVRTNKAYHQQFPLNFEDSTVWILEETRLGS